MNYYEILEISENASQEVIHMAYKALCKKYHPDVYQGDKNFAEEQMKKINEAYTILSDVLKRKEYDASLKNQKYNKQENRSEAKQEYRGTNIDVLLKRGFMALEDGEWVKADQFFEQALNYDAELAEAYIGKLLAEFHFTNIYELKTTILEYENHTNYLRALHFSNDEFKKILKDCALEHKETIYLFALEEEKENTITKLNDAKKKFESICDWKDSREHILNCEKKLEKIQNLINKKKKKKIFFAATISICLTLVLIMTQIVIPSQYYKKAKSLYNSGKVFESCQYFIKANGYQDSAQYLASFDDRYIALGRNHTVKKDAGGTVIAIGNNDYGQCDVSNWRGIISVAASENYTLGLKYDGTVVAAGDNGSNQCDVADWKNIIAISTNFIHSVGLKSDGTVVATGANDARTNVSGWNNIIAISAGTNHTVGLKSDGTVVATGYGVDNMYNVHDWNDIVAISAGGNHIVGLKSDGTVVAVGNNKYNQCDISDWENIIAISAGATWTVGLKSDGTVIAVGLNNYNQCSVEDWKDVIAVYGGGIHTIGLKSDGSFIAVGNNQYNQCDVYEWKDTIMAFSVEAGLLCGYGKEYSHLFE